MTRKQACKFLDWCQRQLGLEDWILELFVQNALPEWATPEDHDTPQPLGLCATNRPYKTAKIWVSPAKCEADDSCPYSALGHEMMHVSAVDTGMESDIGSQPSHEFLWNKLGDLLAAHYAQLRKE